MARDFNFDPNFNSCFREESPDRPVTEASPEAPDEEDEQ